MPDPDVFAELFYRRWADADRVSDCASGSSGRHQGGFNFGGVGIGERLFGRGDLKYVILDLLKDQPRHGYEVIRALEERFRGFYSPSPGSVYPTLQLLADQGYLTSTERDGKRVYAITDEGRKFLEEH